MNIHLPVNWKIFLLKAFDSSNMILLCRFKMCLRPSALLSVSSKSSLASLYWFTEFQFIIIGEMAGLGSNYTTGDRPCYNVKFSPTLLSRLSSS